MVLVHEASGLNDNIQDICGRFAAEGYAALGVDLFEGRNWAVCMARMFAGGMAGNLDYGVPALARDGERDRACAPRRQLACWSSRKAFRSRATIAPTRRSGPR